MMILGVIIGIIAALLFLPVVILLIETLCALKAREGVGPIEGHRPRGFRVAVLIPAHDEEHGIAATASGIVRQLTSSDRCIVVADNCTDATAKRARATGVETIIRTDPQRRGKGYALDFGVQYLANDPPNMVVIVDADCRLGPQTIDALAVCVVRNRRPSQAFNVVLLPPNPDTKRRIAGFSWILKNHVRPAGLAALGLPCQLMGTGMAIPWEAIVSIDLASGDTVEDVRMGLDLAAAGFAPIFCPEACVESDFPPTERGIAIQRERWESGSLRMTFKVAPVMFLRGLLTLNLPLAAMAADLMVPPLIMLLLALMVGLVLSSILAIAGGAILPAMIFCSSMLMLTLALIIAWVRFGRNVLLAQDIFTLPGLSFRKLGQYATMWRGRGAGWIRTDRK